MDRLITILCKKEITEHDNSENRHNIDMLKSTDMTIVINKVA